MNKNKLPKIKLQLHAGIANPDLIEQKKAEVMQKLHDSLKEGNEEGFAQAFSDFAENMQQAVLQEAKLVVKEAEEIIQSVDSSVLVGRGVRQLTSKENEFYQKTIEAMASSNPRQALTDLDVVMPETIIDAVFDDLKEEQDRKSVV